MMILKNEGTRIPWLLLCSNILSVVAVGFFIFGLYFGLRFFYFNFQQIDIAFCTGYIFCGVMLFPLIGILHDIGEDRVSFFLKSPPEDDGTKRYSIFRFLFSFLSLLALTMFLMSYMSEDVQIYFANVLGVIIFLNVMSFYQIEMYRIRQLRKKKIHS
jgi:hypothetical protein